MSANLGRFLLTLAALGGLSACSKPPAAPTVGASANGPAATALDATKPSPMGPAAAQSAAKAPVAPPEVTLPAGRTLRVRTTTALSTKTAKPGQRFEAWLSEPVVVNGTTVLPKGARVEGVVAESDPGGRIKGRAVLGLRLTAVESQGRMLPLQTSVYTRVARGTKSRDAMKIGGGAGVGAAIGAIAAGGAGAGFGALAGAGAGTGVVLATHGAPAVIASESLISFQLRTAVSVPL
ncbi:MAG: hypothetical protein HY820_17540 [Acidobacteria bacterium]|nr:hypothetical protein [Acidobacteriota bacterium]